MLLTSGAVGVSDFFIFLEALQPVKIMIEMRKPKREMVFMGIKKLYGFFCFNLHNNFWKE
jgi:hypothetical protein